MTWFLAGQEFSLCHNIQTSYGAQPAISPVETHVTWSRHETDNLFPPSVEVKNGAISPFPIHLLGIMLSYITLQHHYIILKYQGCIHTLKLELQLYMMLILYTLQP
jgi:hypothetical protein